MREIVILFTLAQLVPVPAPKVQKFADRKMTLPYHPNPDRASSYHAYRFI